MIKIEPSFSEGSFALRPNAAYSNGGFTSTKRTSDIAFLRKDLVVGIVGATVRLVDLESKCQKYFPIGSNVVRPVAISVSPNCRFLAVSFETEDKSPQITVFGVQSMRELRVLRYSSAVTPGSPGSSPGRRSTVTSTAPDLSTATFTSLAFSGDNRKIAAYLPAPYSRLIIYDWDGQEEVNNEPVASPVEWLSFNPWDHRRLVTAGPHFLRYWREYDNTMRANAPIFAGSDPQDGSSYGEHVWVTDDLLVVSRGRAALLGTPERSAHKGLRESRISTPTIRDVVRPSPCRMSTASTLKSSTSEDERAVIDKPDDLLLFYKGAWQCTIAADCAVVKLVVVGESTVVAFGSYGEVSAITILVSKTKKGDPVSISDGKKFGAVFDANGKLTAGPGHNGKGGYSAIRAALAAEGVIEEDVQNSASAAIDAFHETPGETLRGTRFVGGALSLDGRSICMLLDSGQFASFPVSQWETLDPGAVHYTPLTTGLHSSKVTALDTAVWKPFLATCSEDGHVCVLNYSNRTLSLEVDSVIDGTLTALSFHPSGGFLLVGTTDKVTLNAVLIRSLHLEHQLFIRNCSVIKFSPGGDHFAVAAGMGVQVFNTYTYENIAQCVGHRNLVQTVSWHPMENRIVSAARDGHVYEWNLVSSYVRDLLSLQEQGVLPPFSNYVSYFYKKGAAASVENDGIDGRQSPSRGDNVIHSTNAIGKLSDQSQLETEDQCAVISAGCDGEIRILPEALKVPNIPVNGVAFSQAVSSRGSRGQNLFLGTSNGAICPIVASTIVASASNKVKPQSPTQAKSFSKPESLLFSLHGDAVTAMSLSRNGEWLFSASDDGSVMMSRVIIDGIKHLENVDESQVEWFLTTEYDIKKLETAMAELKNKLRTVEAKIEYDKNLTEQRMKEEIEEVIREKEASLQNLKEQITADRAAFKDEDARKAEVLMTMEQQQKVALEELTLLYEKRLTNANDLRQEIEAEQEQYKVKCDKENQEFRDELEKEKNELIEEFEKRINDLELNKDTLESDYTATKERAKVMFEVMEDDQDAEFSDLLEKTRRALRSERAQVTALRGESTLLRNRFEKFVEEAMRHEEQQETARQQLTQATEKVAELEITIERLRTHIDEKNTIIEQKDRQIGEHQQSIRELEKYKFVMEFKNRELAKELDPRDEETADLKDRMKGLSEELSLSRRSNDSLQLIIADKNMKIQSTARELNKSVKDNTEMERRLKSIASELTSLVNSKEESWRFLAQKMYHKWVDGQSTDDARLTDGDEQDQMTEVSRQREFMARSMERIQKQSRIVSEVANSKVSRAVVENAKLLKDIQSLQSENRACKRRYESLKADMKEIMGENAAARSRAVTFKRKVKTAQQPGLSTPGTPVRALRPSTAPPSRLADGAEIDVVAPLITSLQPEQIEQHLDASVSVDRGHYNELEENEDLPVRPSTSAGVLSSAVDVSMFADRMGSSGQTGLKPSRTKKSSTRNAWINRPRDVDPRKGSMPDRQRELSHHYARKMNKSGSHLAVISSSLSSSAPSRPSTAIGMSSDHARVISQRPSSGLVTSFRPKTAPKQRRVVDPFGRLSKNKGRARIGGAGNLFEW